MPALLFVCAILGFNEGKCASCVAGFEWTINPLYLKSSLPLCKYPTISFSTVTTVNCACNALDCSLKLCALLVTCVGNFLFLYHLEHLYYILQCRPVGLAESCHCVMVRVSFNGIETKQFYLCQYTESTSTHHS